MGMLFLERRVCAEATTQAILVRLVSCKAFDVSQVNGVE
jgi:hypothetical protein